MELRPYQNIIIDHMMSVARGATWAGMGMGKTVCTLTALDNLSLIEDVYPALVLAPKRVARDVWPNETRQWPHLKNVAVTAAVGDAAARKRALKMGGEVITMNYENVPWLVEHFDGNLPFRTIVADESTRLKSFRSRQGGSRAKALSQVAHGKVKRFINLTGTPSPNGLKDLWGQTWFLDAGQRLGRTYTAFTQRWFRKSYDGYSIEAMPHAQDQIQTALRDICLTVDGKDWFDLREPVVNNIYVELPASARAIYREMERQMFAQIEEIGVEAFNAAAVTGKCLQMASGAVYYDGEGSWKEVHDEKLQALDSIAEETGSPLLVVYEFKSDKSRILKAFPQARTLDKPGDIEEWNAGKVPMLLVHPASAGHGLNLQHGGHHVVFFGHTWNLEYRQQVIERIGPVRQMQAGYARPVYIYNIIARDTVDEDVLERIATKRRVQDILLESAKRRR